MTGSLVLNPAAGGPLPDAPAPADPLPFHRRLPGYAPTPLRRLAVVERRLGLGQVLLKDESRRLGLPAFKILGASWALYLALAERGGFDLGAWETLDELTALIEPLLPLAAVAATDGNHGRSLARMAALLGLDARILVPRGTAKARIAGIASEGAAVVVVDGTYDETVERAAREEGKRTLLVQDTAWPGYETVPGRVTEGYGTLFREIDAELGDDPDPDLILVQVGVGSLAAAAIVHYRAPGRRRRVRILGVEPLGAACAQTSLRERRRVTVPGPHLSVMAGLNCGALSSLAWPILEAGMDGVIAVEDGRAAEAVRLLDEAGFAAGESGAAGLAGLLELCACTGEAFAAERARLGPDSRILLLLTEGVTDPRSHGRILGR